MTQHTSSPSPTVALIILDGWGHREERAHNAIAQAQTPHWDRLWHTQPHCLLSASAHTVGLPAAQMGNSEVGHLHIGAGRLIEQDLVRINRAISSGLFFENPALIHALQTAEKHQSRLHVISLLSDGGVHSHIEHVQALMKMTAKFSIPHCFLHGILDGRDTPPQSARALLAPLSNLMSTLPRCHLASLVGRYYAMDRDNRWTRTQKAYQLFTDPTSPVRTAPTWLDAITHAYNNGETDEFVAPTRLTLSHLPHPPRTVFAPNDVVIFMHFRADRARQLCHALTAPPHSTHVGFERPQPVSLAAFATLTEYTASLTPHVAFPPADLNQTLGDCVARAGLQQLRLAETEKYPHVTYFFNGGRESPFPNEKRILIPSPKVNTYDMQPAMCAHALTDTLVDALHQSTYRFIVCNFANADMVGHTGHFDATCKAIETLDTCLGRIHTAITETGSHAFITADHGNAEMLFDVHTQQAHTAHTTHPVPFVYIGNTPLAMQPPPEPALYDIAPTVLHLMGLPIPDAMTGRCLFTRGNQHTVR